MTTFETPEPISVTLELGIADIRVVASDRIDTVVEVRPSDPAKGSDVNAAAQTTVDYANGNLQITAPKGWKRWTPWGGHGSVTVRVELPEGSAVRGQAGVATLRCSGRIGECRFRTGVGDIILERTGSVELKAGAGAVSVDEISGRADVKTAGAIRIGLIDGPAAIRNSNGDTWIGEVTGEARANAANGAISVDLALAGIAAKSANGSIRLDEVVRGPVVAQSAMGSVDIGVRDGVAAWLELETKLGHVRNDLADAERPGPGQDTVEINAHTSMGDIAVRRCATGTEGPGS